MWKFDYDRKRILVTGGSSGIGKAVAKAAAREGANVYILSRDETRLAGAVGEIEEHMTPGRQLLSIAADVSNFTSLNDAISRTGKDHQAVKNIDVVIHCAGIVQAGSILSLGWGDATKLLKINVGGTFNVMRVMVPILRERQHSQFIVISSLLSLWPEVPDYVAYAATMAARRDAARALRQDRNIRGTGIKVLTALPPDTLTPAFQAEQAGWSWKRRAFSLASKARPADEVGARIVEGAKKGQKEILCSWDSHLLAAMANGWPGLIKVYMVPFVAWAWLMHKLDRKGYQV